MLLPMQNFTHDEFQPSAQALLFVKQFARMCNTKKNLTNNGYHSFSVIACC